MRNKIFRFIPPLVLLAFAFLIIEPEIMHHALIIGVDYAFHSNRFLDSAMQLQTGHFNLFQSDYGFNQSGRIVNAFYGPITAYFNGLLLLLSKTMFHYQIVTNLIVLMLSGMSMYSLVRKNHVTKFNATMVAMIYMGAYPVMTWVTGQQFTGIGSAIMPLVFIQATNMTNKHDVKVIPFALSMTLLLQTHLASTLFACLAIVPFFMAALLTAKASQRSQLFKHTVQAAFLTVLLNLNLWANLWELFSSNHIIPIFPQTDFSTEAAGWSNHAIDFLGQALTLLFFIMLIYTVIRWQKISLTNKVAVIDGAIFLLLSLEIFPWNALNRLLPFLATTLQMPKRLLTVSCILFLLAVGIDLSKPQGKTWINLLKNTALIIIFIVFAINVHNSVNNNLSDWQTKQVVSSNQTTKSLTITENNPQRLRKLLVHANFQTAIPVIQKTVPDYLPANRQINPANYYQMDFKRNYYHQIIKPHLTVKKWVYRGALNLEWHNPSKQKQWQMVPLTKYAHSSVKLNGIQDSHIKTSAIGTVIVDAKPGQNRLQLTYQTSLIWKILIGGFILAWIGLMINLIFRKGKWYRK